MNIHRYNKITKEFLYSEEALLDPLETKKQGKKIYLLPPNSTFIQPSLEEKDGFAIIFNENNNSWEYIEDHRQKLNDSGVIIEGSGTPYFLPEDTWLSHPRYMTKLGSLPKNAILKKPQKPKEIIENELENHYTNLIQSILDKEAQKLKYDDCKSVCSYFDSGVQKFDDEGKSFRKWRSAVWNKGYEFLDQVKSGKMEIPSEEKLIEMLPKLEIIYS